MVNISFRKKDLIGACVLLITASLILFPSAVTANKVSPLCLPIGSCHPIKSGGQSIGTYIIWENDYPDFWDAIRCQRAGSIPYCDIADDFHTDRMWTITGAQWESVDDPAYVWDETCDMIIYEYTANGPGDPVVEFWDVTSTREFLGEIADVLWYRYTIDLAALGMEFNLSAGDYYILLRPVTYGITGESFWMTSDGNPNSQSEVYLRCEYFGYPNWTACHEVIPDSYYDVNFRLFGEGEGIPELELGDISGGFGVRTSIKNLGDGEATNVYWSISFDNGIILFPPDGFKTGTFASLGAGLEEPLNTMVFGFGGFLQPVNLTVTVKADNLLPVKKTMPAKVFLFFVII